MVKQTDTTSAQYRIWHDTFLCEIRYIDTMSTDYLKIFGTFTTGDSLLDRQAHNEMVLRRFTIIRMIEFFHENVRVYIKNPEDSKTIYCLLQEHLQNWQKELHQSLRTDNAPFEELALMDKFADAVYEHAKWYLDSALIDTPFARTLRKDNRSVLDLLKKPDSTDENGESLVIHPKRNSMSDVFSQGAIQMERRF